LIDFGLSKEGVNHNDAKSFVGTGGYHAPEMMKRTGHGKGADWYQLGVVLFEMLTGTTPNHENNK